MVIGIYMSRWRLIGISRRIGLIEQRLEVGPPDRRGFIICRHF